MKKRSIYSGLVAAYVTFIALWLLLRLLFFDRFWPLAALNTIAEYLFIPLPLLFVAGLRQRDRPALRPLALPAIAFGVMLGPLFLPPALRSLPATVRVDAYSAQSITAMSYNVLKSNRDYAAILDSIRAANPDLIGLQELTRATADHLAGALATEYPYYSESKLQGKIMVGLFSRFPIEQAEQMDLPPLNLALRALVNIDGIRVQVFVLHLSPNNLLTYPLNELPQVLGERYAARANEVTLIEAALADLSAPVLIICDCNMTDTSETWARLDAMLNDSFRETGWGFGHTLHPAFSPVPLQRVDYVWHSDEFVATQAFVGRRGGSDHLPFVAKLALVPGQSD